MFYEESKSCVLKPVIFNLTVFHDIGFLKIDFRNADPVATGLPKFFSLPERSLTYLHAH
jgi:hypothetical protein